MTKIQTHNRLNVFTGHFGSGKTEIAINFALRAAKAGKKVTIIDIDIVNTYFRTMDAKVELEAAGIKVISSRFANTNLDLPTVPAEVYGALQDQESLVVMDVGGDEDGAMVLGQYNRYFQAEPYNMFFVVNAMRPLTATPEDVCVYLAEIERASRLKATGLINNTNLSCDSSLAVLLEGQRIVEQVSERIGVPVSYISGRHDIVAELPKELADRAFGLDLFLQLPY